MSVDQSLPTTAPYGKGVWTDYEDNWRGKDANWLQSRSLLRYANPTARDADLTAPEVGQFVFDASVDILEYRSGTGVWKYYKPLPQFTTTTQDDASGVALSHLNAGGKGVILGPGSPAGTGLVTLNAPLTVMGGALTADTTGVTVKTGTKTVKLTTSATDLVSDSPISAPSVTLTGTGTVLTAAGKTLAVGTLTADQGTVTNISMSGTLTGGILNGTRALVNGVSIGWDTGLTAPAASAGSIFGAGGYIAQQGFFTGDGSSALMRQRTPTTGAAGTAYLQVGATDITAGPTNSAGSVYMYPFLRIMQGKGIAWHNAGGTHQAWGAIAIYSASDPGASNFPDGTIWFS